MDKPEGSTPNLKLRNARLAQQWSQQNLADQLGTTKLSVSRWERGITSPTPYFRFKLVQIFDKSEQELGLSPEDPPLEDQNQSQDDNVQQENQNIVNVEERKTTKDPSDTPIPLQPLSYTRSRHYMLEQVHSIWITDMLEHSLHGMVPIVLGLREEPGIVANPWRLILQELERPAQLLPNETHIEQIYQATNGQLLILGEPGSGKTTLLLELTRRLLKRAQQDQQYPLPVIFNLSSWARKRGTLENWLIDELQEKYQVPSILAQEWVTNDLLLPLLDGLDEVVTAQRTACIKAINAYRARHGLLPLVICCRKAEYPEQTEKIQLRSAVIVQPLAQQQINDYLKQWGQPAAGLLEALQQSNDLQELATSPLMLNILILTYHNKPASEIVNRDNTKSCNHYIFENYTHRMLSRRSANIHYSADQMVYWLSWLARQMLEQRQTVFYLEQIQFSWLTNRWIAAIIPELALSLIFGLVVGLVFGILNGIYSNPWVGIHVGIATGCFNTCLHAFINGIVSDWGKAYLQTAEGAKTCIMPLKKFITTVQYWFPKKFIYGLFFATYNGLFYGIYISTLGSLFFDLHGRLMYGLLYGILLGITFGAFGRLEPIIKPVEILNWTLKSVRQKGKRFITIGFITGALIGQIYPMNVKLGLITATTIGSLIMSGWSTAEIKSQKHLQPNQGIWRSARNGLALGLFAGCLTWLLIGGTFSLFYGPVQGFWLGVVPALVIGSSLGLLQGGLAFLLHGTLHFLLWRCGNIPWSYVQFLDEAANRILLRKVGGGYVFIHRLLVEYFASLTSTQENIKQIQEKQINTARRSV